MNLVKETKWLLREERVCRWCKQIFTKGSSVAVFLGHLKTERKKGQIIYMKAGETKEITLDRDTTIHIIYNEYEFPSLNSQKISRSRFLPEGDYEVSTKPTKKRIRLILNEKRIRLILNGKEVEPIR